MFDRFFRAAQKGRFPKLNDRDDLWQILLVLTDRKIADQFRRATAERRGGGRNVAVTDLAVSDSQAAADPVDAQPGPEFAAALRETVEQALARLTKPHTREVALLRMEGHTIADISRQLGIAEATVRRKLRVIRDAWKWEFEE